MGAFKRQDWNDLIAAVNDTLQNPPENTDCDPIGPIDEVDPDHIWTKSDVLEVQGALQQTCPDISFDDIPDLWKQSIIDEINDAIGQAWCNCEPNWECVPCPWPKLSGPAYKWPAPDFSIKSSVDLATPCPWFHYAQHIDGLILGLPEYVGVVLVPVCYIEFTSLGLTTSHIVLPMSFVCNVHGEVDVPQWALDLLPPACGSSGNAGWMVADGDGEAGNPPVPWSRRTWLHIYLQCSTLCDPPGLPVGTPALIHYLGD